MIHHARGPETSKVSREQAEKQLKVHPNFPKKAELELWEEDGHWIAAWHEAEFPPSKDEGSEEGPPEEAGPPKEEKPDDGDGDDEGGPPSDDGGEGGPPKEHGEKGKGGEQHELTQIMHLVTQMAMALGIEPGGMGPAESPVPGPEGPPPPGPPGGPPGPPHGPHGGPAGPDQTVQHQRALKPGEAPPGTTPVGAPAFASTVADSHPWKGHIGKSASFTVANEIPENVTLASIDMELQKLAYNTRCKELPGGFKVKQVAEARNEDGKRVAKALIAAY